MLIRVAEAGDIEVVEALRYAALSASAPSVYAPREVVELLDGLDVDAVAARLVEHGGTVLDATRYSLALGEGRSNDFVFVADPDGVRVELMKL